MVSSPPWQLWRRDEDMAKKSDDFPLPGHPAHRANRRISHVPRRSWMKRILVYALILAALFYLFRPRGSSEPETQTSIKHPHDSDAVQTTHEQPDGSEAGESVRNAHRPIRESPFKKKAAGRQRQSQSAGEPARTIQFPSLKSSLIALRKSRLSRRKGDVLFAAASLKSASTLLQMACEMSMEGRNQVHFAFMGEDDVSIKDLLDVNGIDRDCRFMTHDARPDHFKLSTQYRLRTAAKTALSLINVYMQPQVVIVDSTAAEKDYFLASARDEVPSTKAALIELPARPMESLGWISTLDASALSAWNKVRFDLLVHATPTKTANLKRLLRSIAGADLTGIATPHITIELPNTIDEPLEEFLRFFRWPRPSPWGAQQSQMISLRRRISHQLLDEEDSSVRFVESFWPTDPRISHVLVLSPHTEVTSQFFQYVKYCLLRRLSSEIASTKDGGNSSLMGFSLSVPHTLADGTTAFSPPAPKDGREDKPGQTDFLWQRPNSEAMLFMGDKWIELHNFISRTLLQKKTMSSPPPGLVSPKKTTGKRYPAWLEYSLQLSRLRGYYTLYPSRATADAILGVHNDVPDPPEEYMKDAPRKEPLSSHEDDSADGFNPASHVDMADILPKKGNLQSTGDIPLLSWDGTPTTRTSLEQKAQEYTALFRRDVGGCTEEDAELVRKERVDANDLFCSR